MSMPDPIFGLPTTLLILRNSRSLFEEHPQILGPGFDETRDHALFDDRIAARPQACAQEDIGDVTPTATRAVKEVSRLAVTRHLAAECDFAVTRILAANGTAAVEPLKMTSAMESPRRCLAEVSPITQRTASMTFDLPQPFGPTTPVSSEGK